MVFFIHNYLLYVYLEMEMSDNIIDNKVVKRHYPRDNRDEKLSRVCLLYKQIYVYFN